MEDKIDHYLKTYHLLLKGGSEVFVRDLEGPHKRIGSTLHMLADKDGIDLGAFGYTFLRLPAGIDKVKMVLLGQSEAVFMKAGIFLERDWQRVTAPARRRKMLFDGKSRLACYVCSISDVDDLATILTAFQIEWNKMHRLLNQVKDGQFTLWKNAGEERLVSEISRLFSLTTDETRKLLAFEGIGNGYKLMAKIRDNQMNFQVRLLAGSLVDYTKATQRWWKHISASVKPKIHINHAPVYVISSNLHGLANLICPFVRSQEKEILSFVDNSNLSAIWQRIRDEKLPGEKEDFLYYAVRAFSQNLSLVKRKRFLAKRSEEERRGGLRTVWAEHYLDINSQVLPINEIQFGSLDPRLVVSKKTESVLKTSNAIILNFDYPLGFGAYHLLQEIMENVTEVRGVYVLGKAATFNGEVGDVMIPESVYDEHSRNTYFFNNCFSAGDLSPLLHRSSLLDHQKAVTVRGTFLQNKELVDTYISQGITIAEMESGPYMNAVYEACYPDRYPQNEHISLSRVPFDFGMIHYASDTHYSKAESLGTKSLSFEGVSPVYVSTIAVLKRIFEREVRYLNG